jgi:hypothetical protein
MAFKPKCGWKVYEGRCLFCPEISFGSRVGVSCPRYRGGFSERGAGGTGKCRYSRQPERCVERGRPSLMPARLTKRRRRWQGMRKPGAIRCRFPHRMRSEKTSEGEFNFLSLHWMRSSFERMALKSVCARTGGRSGELDRCIADGKGRVQESAGIGRIPRKTAR